jgi:hypothetical protein
MRAYLGVVRRRRPVLRVPMPGKAAAAYRAGRHIAPGQATGVRTFTQDLLARVGPGGTVDVPYDLSRG